MKIAQEYLRPVTRKGTVTIPVEVRRLLGVRPRGRVTFRVIEGKRVELLPPSMTLESTFGSVKARTRRLDFKKVRDEAIEAKVRRTINTLKK